MNNIVIIGKDSPLWFISIIEVDLYMD